MVIFKVSYDRNYHENNCAFRKHENFVRRSYLKGKKTKKNCTWIDFWQQYDLINATLLQISMFRLIRTFTTLRYDCCHHQCKFKF